MFWKIWNIIFEMSYGQGVKLQYCPNNRSLLFSTRGSQEIAKNWFFRKTLAPEKFIIGNFFQHRTIWKLTSGRFRKCISYEAYGDFYASYHRSKSTHGWKSESVPIIMRCQKKRHGHNFEFWALPLNQRGTNHVGPTLIQWQGPKLKIVAVSFFLDASSP